MSAMQAMMTKMLGDMLANLPPDIKEKIEAIGQFTVMLDKRLQGIEYDLRLIKNNLGISEERLLTHERRDKHGNGTAPPATDRGT
jgi:hypothetical protein